MSGDERTDAPGAPAPGVTVPEVPAPAAPAPTPDVESAPAPSAAAAPPAAAEVVCASCGEPNDADAKFCEACGADLPSEASGAPSPSGESAPAAAPAAAPDPAPTDRPAFETGPTKSTEPAHPLAEGEAPDAPVAAAVSRECSNCGGAIADDGYCEQCGQPFRSERDHWEESPSAWVGGVCDRGIRHAANEDAMAIGADAEPGTFAALVVCDGVSSTPGSDLASLAAARAARDVLLAGRAADLEADAADRAAGVPAVSSARDREDDIARWSARLVDAAAAASAAITAAIGELATHDNPPSCTFTAAVLDGPLVVTGQIGDSRAYWIPDAGAARQLTTDDSWAQDMIALGMPRAQAETAPQAHSITRWMGADSIDEVPHCVPTFPHGPGWLLVCSDGLWNYSSPADDLAALVRSTEATVGGDPTELAGALVAWANAQGGHDNISAALARVPGPALAGDSGPDTIPTAVVAPPHPPVAPPADRGATEPPAPPSPVG